MSTDTPYSNGRVLFIILLMGVLWFTLLGYRDLVTPDEGRYAEVPREMVASGDWLTPTQNGYKYLMKPPLQYWATALSYEVFGQSNWSARLWIALISFAGLLWAGYVGRQLWGRQAGFYALLIAGSGWLYSAMGHVLTLDMTLAVFMSVGIGAFVLAQTQRDDATRCRNWMLLGWAALGLAVMSKGLVGVVLPGAAVVIYSLWQRDWVLWRSMHIGKGLLLFLLVTAPWFVMVSLANPGFAEYFFIHEHFSRYTSNVHSRGRPLLYFVPFLFLGMLPFLVTGTRALFRPSFSWRPGAPGFNAERFMWVFVVVVFVFFSLGRSKLIPYILPLFPVLAWLTAQRLKMLQTVRGDAWAIVVVGVIFLVAASQVFRLESADFPLPALHDFQPWIALAGVLFLVAGIAAVRVKSAQTAVTVLALVSLLAVQLLLWTAQTLNTTRSSRELADVLAGYPATYPIYAIGIYPRSLSFYLGRELILVDYDHHELDYGKALDARGYIEDWGAFRHVWPTLDNAIAVVDTEDFNEYNKQGMQFNVVYEDPLKTAFVKQAGPVQND